MTVAPQSETFHSPGPGNWPIILSLSCTAHPSNVRDDDATPGEEMAMFVTRSDGVLNGIYGCAQFEGQEELSDDHPDILAFRAALANPVPGQVTAGKLIQALAELNLLDAVDAVVAGADALMQRLWARGAVFDRHDPMVIGIATALGKTPTELDDIFRLAATK